MEAMFGVIDLDVDLPYATEIVISSKKTVAREGVVFAAEMSRRWSSVDGTLCTVYH